MIKKILFTLIICNVFGIHAECRQDTVYLYNIGADSTQKTLLSRQINHFNSGNMVTEEIVQVRDHTDWTNFSLKEYSYDGQSNTTLILEKQWQSNTSSWTNKKKTIYAYDSKNNRTETIDQNWNTSGNDWVNNIKVLNAFDANNHNTSTTWFQWDAVTWNNRDMVEMTYSSDLLSEKLAYLWNKDSVKWIATNKYQYTYDDNGMLTEESRSGKSQNSQWAYQARTLYSHSSSLYEEILQFWGTNNWVNSYKNSISYNTDGSKSAEYLMFWNSVDNSWLNDSKTTFEYDAQGNLKASNQYISWNSSSGTYMSRRRTEYICAYSLTVNSINKFPGILIYPNPCNSARITVEAQNPGAYALFDITGQLLQQGLFTAGKNELVLQDGLSDGIYFLKVDQSTYKLLYNP